MTRIDIQNFHPEWASAPGETIAELLTNRHLSINEFADQIGSPLEQTNKLLAGQVKITSDIASQLEHIFGVSQKFWLKRESQYRQDLIRLKHVTDEENVKWLSEFPIKEMIRLGWLEDSASQLTACLRFFGAPDIKTWQKTYENIFGTTAFRTSPAFKSQTGAVAAWLRQGEIEGEALNCKAWNPKAFKEALSKIRSLTRKQDPHIFISQLQDYCADCGVAVVILRALPGCRASGATRFLESGKALLLLSFRYLSDDHFWFTFFHEAGHLLLHNKSALFLEGADTESSDDEKEANEFAANTLIPSKFESDLLNLRANGIAVVKFARSAGVSPGIIVGQLQHRGIIKHRQLNNLKRRYVWAD